MAYPQHVLDDIRARLRVSEVVGRKHKLRKQGGEFVALDDHSLTVNDKKGIWHDFGSGKDGGDVFKWFQEREGLSFAAAVEECAKLAGVDLPGKTSGASRANGARRPNGRAQGDRRANGSSRTAGADRDRSEDHQRGQDRSNGAAASSKRETVATYDYLSGDDILLYQVVRFEWLDKGKRRKSFGQRRPSPDNDGTWLWGLDAGEYSRRAGQDWLTFDEDRYERQGHTERRTFEDSATHTLYRLPRVKDEVGLGEDGATVHLTEGEKDVHTLERWGLLATTNSGGAKNWTQYHAELLRGADVVIWVDNDEAGREGALKRARALRGVARRVRMLDVAEHWPACPEKGDATDWVERGGLGLDRLYEVLDRLPTWRPALKISKFGRLRWGDHMLAPPKYPWLIKGLVPAGEPVLVYGRTHSGKSFFVFDMAMHVARGVAYHGKRVQPGLVVYCAMEAGRGFAKRMAAYRKRHEVPDDEQVPFELLTKRADLFSAEVDTDALIAEITAIAEEYDAPVAMIIIDTYQAATPGMKEIASEDVSKTNARLDRIRDTFKCTLVIVHHPNKVGNEPSGHQSITNGIETSIEIRKKKEGANEARDAHNRVIREAWVRKQREGISDVRWEFTLPAVNIGFDEDGEEITSCVVAPVGDGDLVMPEDAAKQQRPPGLGGFRINQNETSFFRAMLRALDQGGVAPASVGLVLPGIARVVDYKLVREIYGRTNLHEEEDQAKGKERLKKQITRARKYLSEREVVASETPYIWPTGKRVMMVDGSFYPPSGAVEDRRRRRDTDGDDDGPSDVMGKLGV